jgi:Glycosyltransferases involved in cell wall biogenesis
MKSTLSLCLIVKNEEAVLARCLSTAKLYADEIIIVDTGSADKTKEIAARFTDKIFDFKWIDDFSAARNFSFSKAKSDYLMWLDADDVVTEENALKIQDLMRDASADVYFLIYNGSYDELGKPTFYYFRERIMKNSPAAKWKGFIHEAVPPFGKTEYTDIAVEHRKKGGGSGSRNLDIYEKKLKEGVKFDARDKFYYARELYYNGRYKDAEKIFLEFLTAGGYLPNMIDARLFLKRCEDALGEKDRGLELLLPVLRITAPTAEISSEIAGYFADKGLYRIAAWWYEAALDSPAEPPSGAFINKDYSGLVPTLGLTLCYDRLGEKEKARNFCEMSYKINPNDKRVIYNKKYFEGNQNINCTN